MAKKNYETCLKEIQARPGVAAVIEMAKRLEAVSSVKTQQFSHKQLESQQVKLRPASRADR